MPTTPAANLILTDNPASDATWSSMAGPDGTFELVVSLELEDMTVRLVRELRCDGVAVLRTLAWSATYVDPSDVTDAYESLRRHEDCFDYWSIGATAFGSDWLTPIVATHMTDYVEKRERALAKALRKEEEARRKAEDELAAAAKITAYCRVLKKRFAVTLEYGRDDKAFWSITFDESWERDRFWDWFNWQASRFDDFADYMKDGDRLELERKLLKEMLITEQAVKKQGLGSGGRRPLRFWRGEV